MWSMSAPDDDKSCAHVSIDDSKRKGIIINTINILTSEKLVIFPYFSRRHGDIQNLHE